MVSRLEKGLIVVPIFFVILLITGQLLGQPALLGFVTSGSMESTLNEGDGFVAIPAAVTDEPEPGDVVVFRAEQIQGGGLTTHRIVEETDRGYITKGDANPFTDQDGDEPPVKSEQIVAVVWQPGGEVLAIPGVGTVVTGTQDVLQTVQVHIASAIGTRSLLGPQGLAYLLFALSIALYAVDAWRDSGRDRTTRDRSRRSGTSARLVVGVFAVLLVLGATAAMVVPAGTQEYGVVSAEFESENPTVIERGTSEELEYAVPNAGLVPVYAYVTPQSPGVDVDPQRLRVGSRGEASTTVTLTAPDETGYYRLFVDEHRYLAVLPPGVIDELYGVHPWAPLVVINALLGGGIVGLGLLLLRGEPARIRSRESRAKPPLYRRVLREIYR